MSVIWKYGIPLADAFTLELPRGATLLHVDEQRGTPQLWAMVVPGRDKEKRTFVLLGTGHTSPHSPDSLKHIGTFQLEGGALVFHLFEVRQ